MTEILVIGYGNTLRGDDGVGVAIAHRLTAAGLPASVRVLAEHQLLPEMADDLACVRAAVFIDAAVDQAPGTISRRTLEAPDAEVDRGGGGRRVMGHRMTPEGLLALTRLLHGRCPRAAIVAVGALSLAAGDGLSAPVAHAADRLVEQLSGDLRSMAAGDMPAVIAPSR